MPEVGEFFDLFFVFEASQRNGTAINRLKWTYFVLKITEILRNLKLQMPQVFEFFRTYFYSNSNVIGLPKIA